ncbi:hypothetical protein ACFV6F_20240 [Kitasatospora phosalacinea]|uniref:hypothetical protein n=1 Tax=Kitasatospora phosalacinea TaxID=2065 RepID=UPI0036497737
MAEPAEPVETAEQAGTGKRRGGPTVLRLEVSAEGGERPAALTDEQAFAWWETLPAELRERVDDSVRSGASGAVGVLAVAGGRFGVSPAQAAAIVAARAAAVRPPAGLGVDRWTMVRRVGLFRRPVVAVEARLGGYGARGRLVRVVAVGESEDVELAVVDADTADRCLRDDPRAAHRRPVEVAAELLGRQAAAAIGVPFRFGGNRP